MCFAPRTSIQSPPFGEHVAHRLAGSISLRCWSMTMPVSVLARVTVPLVGLELAGQQLEQGRLAGAVGADHADPVAALDAQGEVPDDRAFAVALADLLGVDHRLRLHVVLGERELGGAGGASIAARARASRAAW